MKKRVLIMVSVMGAIAAVAALVGLSILGIRQAMQDSLRRSTEDAVLVISMSVAQEYEKGRSLSPSEIDDLIRILINGSVINGGFDRNQKATDLFGTPFRVGHYVAGKAQVITVTSAGPDRLFDTADDIIRTTSREAALPSKP
jgi:hypothetical protein